MDRRTSLDYRPKRLVEHFIEYTAAVTVATAAFVILGWLAGF